MVHYDPVESSIASNWIIGDELLAAQRIFPMIQTSQISAMIAQYDRRDLFRFGSVRPRAPATESEGGGYSATQDRYLCKEWAYHKDIGDEEDAYTTAPYDADRDATAHVTQLLKLKRDELFAAAAFGVGIWGTDVLGIAGATNYGLNQVRQWSDWVTPSAPHQDIEYYRKWMALASGGFEPNVLAITPDVWAALKHHPTIIARYVQTTPMPEATLQQVAQFLEIDRIVVCGAVGNFGPLGGQWIGQYLFGQGQALLCHVPSSPSRINPSAGYTFGWTGANHAGTVVTVERFRLANDAKGDRITGSIHMDVHVQENILGVYFRNLAVGMGPAQVVI
jgi:hypothetical protein